MYLGHMPYTVPENGVREVATSSTVDALLDENAKLKRELAAERAARAELRAEYDATLQKILHEVRALRRYVTRHGVDA